MVAPLVIPLVLAIGTGVAAAGKGISDIVQARRVVNEARDEHASAVDALERCQSHTHRLAEEYGKEQLRAQAVTIGRFAAWLELNEHLVERLDRKFVGGVEVVAPSLPRMKFDVDQAKRGLSGGFGALSAAASAQGAALWGVTSFASASTGTAISALSGAAATNATLAWLGGGSLAAGGGGIAAGAVVLNLIMIAPGVLIGGITVGVMGARQKARAHEYAARVAVSVDNMATARALLEQVDERIREIRSILSGLVARAEDSLESLELLDFDPDIHGAVFLRVLQLATAIGEVIETPILDPETGVLTDVSIKIVEKYS